MKILGIDYGLARIGLAISDQSETIAGPVGTVSEDYLPKQLKKVCAIAREQKAEKLVIGLPKNMDGSEGRLSAQIREFAQQLAQMLGLLYEFIDERLTTVSAHQYLNTANVRGSKKRKNVVDTVAAVIILQNYLDKTKGEKEHV